MYARLSSQLSDFRGSVPKIGKNCPRTNDSGCAHPAGRHSAFLRRTLVQDHHVLIHDARAHLHHPVSMPRQQLRSGGRVPIHNPALY
jgi:hypothetical protein